MKKTTITILLIMVLVVAGLLVALQLGVKKANSPVDLSSINSVAPAPGADLDKVAEVTVEENQTAELTLAEDNKLNGSPTTWLVTYTDNGFEPKSIAIGLGDTVVFKNKSSRDMWVANALHPTHEAYDGTSLSEHCSGGTQVSFDQCVVSDTYSFMFNKVGAWGYHNHVSASHFGQVLVK